MTCEYTKTGYSHKYNVQKTRILEALYYFYPNWVTADVIAEYTGQQVHTITDAISKWFQKHYKYCSRRRVKNYPKQKYEFKLRKFGMKSLLAYKKRIYKGFDLNCNRRVPIKVDKYIVLNKNGIDMSINEDDLPDIKEFLSNESNLKSFRIFLYI